MFRAARSRVGAFTCDCRGVGTDWRVDELRAIASALLGTVDIVAGPADLAADFRAMIGAAMEKNVPDVAAAVDAAARDGAVRQAGRARDRGPDRPPRRRRPAAGTTCSVVGRREPRLPPLRGRAALGGERAGACGAGQLVRGGSDDPASGGALAQAT